MTLAFVAWTFRGGPSPAESAENDSKHYESRTNIFPRTRERAVPSKRTSERANELYATYGQIDFDA